jgi:hypothetical protein
MMMENVLNLKENKIQKIEFNMIILHVVISSLYVVFATIVDEYLKNGNEIKQDKNQKKKTVGNVRNKVK